MCKWIPASSLQVEKLKIRKLGDLPAITQSITRVGFELEDETKLLRPRQRGKGPQYQNPIFLLQMMWRRRHCLSLLEFLLMASRLGEERRRFWIVFRYFSDASGIAPRRQMHKTRVKLLREKKVYLLTNVKHQSLSILLLHSVMGNDCLSFSNLKDSDSGPATWFLWLFLRTQSESKGRQNLVRLRWTF